MRTRMWFAICVACVLAFAVGTLAQTSDTRSSQSTSAKTITVTGCIQRNSETAGTSGTSGGMSSTSATEFLLTNVSKGTSEMSGSTSGTSGTSGMSSGSTMSGSTANEYRLDADSSKLSPHVGHKVEITGTLEKSSGGSSSSYGTTGSSSSSSSSENQPKLKVDKVRMISSSCS